MEEHSFSLFTLFRDIDLDTIFFNFEPNPQKTPLKLHNEHKAKLLPHFVAGTSMANIVATHMEKLHNIQKDKEIMFQKLFEKYNLEQIKDLIELFAQEKGLDTYQKEELYKTIENQYKLY
tara:strand:- start:1971 stop:2330 length:360 start_codon:yes stop_codon:yes gene_type:complete